MQQEFRNIFKEWGCPSKVRVDNGAPWGSWSDLPPCLALWIIGLGIDMHWNNPGRPQENGVIERSQGTGVRWAEPKQCRTITELQKRIDHEDYVQRERYRAIDGEPRLTAFPALRTAGRHFDADWERTHWDWNRVLDHLSTYAVVRQVDCSGKIGHYGTKLYVGTLHKRTTVYVQFDPHQIAWIITDKQGHQLRQIPANLTPTDVRQLKLPRRT